MTENEINRACAELCGWKWYQIVKVRYNGKESYPVTFRILVAPFTIQEWTRCGNPLPEVATGEEEALPYSGSDFCSPNVPHNTLLELLTAIEREDKQHEFNIQFCTLANLDEYDGAGCVVIPILRVPMPVIVECALRATGRWIE